MWCCMHLTQLNMTYRIFSHIFDWYFTVFGLMPGPDYTNSWILTRFCCGWKGKTQTGFVVWHNKKRTTSWTKVQYVRILFYLVRQLLRYVPWQPIISMNFLTLPLDDTHGHNLWLALWLLTWWPSGKTKISLQSLWSRV